MNLKRGLVASFAAVGIIMGIAPGIASADKTIIPPPPPSQDTELQKNLRAVFPLLITGIGGGVAGGAGAALGGGTLLPAPGGNPGVGGAVGGGAGGGLAGGVGAGMLIVA